MSKIIKGSWRTSAAAVLAALGAIGAAGAAYLDGNPETVPDWATAGTLLVVAVGLFMSRDNKVSSEEAGAPAKVGAGK